MFRKTTKTEKPFLSCREQMVPRYESHKIERNYRNLCFQLVTREVEGYISGQGHDEFNVAIKFERSLVDGQTKVSCTATVTKVEKEK